MHLVHAAARVSLQDRVAACDVAWDMRTYRCECVRPVLVTGCTGCTVPPFETPGNAFWCELALVS